MKSVVVVCCLLAVAMAAIDPEWEEFKVKFGRKYNNPTEEMFRRKIFLNNKMRIDQNNQRYAEGKSTFTMGINKFADWTTQEVVSRMTGYKPSKDLKKAANLTQPFNSQSRQLLGSIDWRDYGCIGGVKDQGGCGSCWAFSVTGAIEFSNCNAGHGLTSVSEQNLVDCTYDYGNGGCNGGNMEVSFQYVIDNGGIDTEASYPYEAAGTTPNCRFNSNTVGATIYKYLDVAADETSLAQAVDHSAVSIGIDASQPSFSYYTGGTYYDPLCSSTSLNHAVLAVGYGTDGTGDYWIVKNSWGEGWGMSGYINMARNRGNNCGVSSWASYPFS